jgi:hypothetical protein
LWRNTPGSSIVKMHQFMHHYWFVTFWPTWTQLCFLNQPTHMTWLGQAFSYFPNWNSFWKDDSDDSRDYRKFAHRVMCDPKKSVPGPFPKVETALVVMHQCRRGVLWRQ